MGTGVREARTGARPHRSIASVLLVFVARSWAVGFELRPHPACGPYGESGRKTTQHVGRRGSWPRPGRQSAAAAWQTLLSPLGERPQAWALPELLVAPARRRRGRGMAVEHDWGLCVERAR